MEPVVDTFGILATIGLILQLYAVPYGGYFFGIYVRHKCLPEEGTELKSLLLIGFPVCLVVVTPILMAAEKSLVSIGYPYILTVGITMEHGLVVHETAIARINKLIKKQK